MKPSSKLYLITRVDLSPGQQAVQSAHALTELSMQHPEPFKEWYHDSNTLAFLVVEDEPTLKVLLDKA